MSLPKSQGYMELMLPFELAQTEEDYKEGIINIKVYGEVLGEEKSFSLIYELSKVKMYENDDYNEIINLLKNNVNKKVKVLFKISKGKIKDLKLDLSSLGSIYNDNRFKEFELLGWGINSRTDENYIVNNKIVLGPDEKDIRIANMLIYIVTIPILLLSILIVIGRTLAAIFTVPMTIFMVAIFKYINNTKIEIENSIINKINLFNKKKIIGHVSEIETFAEGISYITVLKNNKEFFRFTIHGRDDNYYFYDYLNNNYKISIYKVGSKIISCFYFISGIASIFIGYFFIGILLLCKGLDELLKQFQIIDNKIIYKRLFINKKNNLSDLTRIVYKKKVYHGQIRIVRYTIIGFNESSKVFKVGDLIEKDFETLRELAKKYNIKMERKSF